MKDPVGVEGLGLFDQRQPPTPDPGGATPDRGGRRTATTLHRDPVARASDPETSHQAAASMRDHAQVQRQAILAYLQAHPEGCTADDLDLALDWRPSTAGRRLGELLGAAHDYVVVRLDGGYDYAPLGALSLPSITRKTRQGREAFVHLHRDHLDAVLGRR